MPRVVHVDSAFQVFKWIHGEGIGVEAHRFTAIVPQLLVKLASVGGLQLSSLLLIASLAHVLVPYVIFVVIAHGFRLPWIAMALALAQVLCTRLTFYGIVLEANYLLSYPFLLAAVLEAAPEPSRRPVVVMGAVAALFLVLLVHPVGCVVAFFILVAKRLRDGSQARLVYVLAAICLAWPMLGRLLFPPTGYEAGLYASTAEGLHALTSPAQNPVWRFLVDHSWAATGHYLMLWCVLLVLVLLYVRRKAFLELALCLAAMGGYLVLNMFTYHQGETAMMMEKNLLPLAVFVALPLMLELARGTARTQWFAAVGLVVVLFIQFRGISFASRPARERLTRIEQLVQRCHDDGVHKACVLAEDLDRNGLHIHWALAFETLLVSARSGPAHACTVVSAQACPPTTTGADLSGLIEEGAICGNGTPYFRLPVGPYAVLSSR